MVAAGASFKVLQAGDTLYLGNLLEDGTYDIGTIPNSNCGLENVFIDDVAIVDVVNKKFNIFKIYFCRIKKIDIFATAKRKNNRST